MTTASEKAVHIFVQIDHQKQVKVEFDHDLVTGAEIKVAAGVPSDYELAIVRGRTHTNLSDKEQITIEDGEHFIAVPGGSVSR